MKIKSQFLISIISFSVLFAVIGASVIVTMQQTGHLDSEENIARSIQTQAGNLVYISNNYFLYQESSAIDLWQSEVSLLYSQLSKISPSNPQQQALINNVNADVQHLNTVFAGVISLLENVPTNVSVRVLPEFQTAWSRMAVQAQALAFDSQQLSQNIRDQVNQLNFTNILLVFSFLAAFGAYFIVNYLITYRNTLKSISELQAGIALVGSGNLEHSLKVDKKDEVGDISRSFNQMITNLKTVIASKADLEKEIEERKKAEEALRRLNERFEMAQHAAGVGVWDWDIKSGLLEWSTEMFRLFGLDSRNSLASFATWKSVLHPEDKDLAASEIDKALKERSFLDNEYRIIRPNGQVSWINALGQGEYDSGGKPIRMRGICLDITERKKTEGELSQSEKKYRRLFETSQDGIISRDLKGRMIDCNRAYIKLLGYSKEELKPLSFEQLMPQKWHDQRGKVVKEVLETGGSILFEREYTRKDGSVFSASVRTWRLTDDKGKPVGVWSIVRDITERKNAENQLRETRDYLENLLNYANAPIIVWDTEFRITMFNHAFEYLTGIAASDVVGKRLNMLFPEDRKAEAMAHIKDALEGEYWESVEIPILHKDGSAKIVLWNSANILDPNRKSVVATIAQGQDITDRKKAEAKLEEYANNLESLVEERTKQLKDSERLAAIGSTAGMVGHDIRNPLQAILGDVYLLKSEVSALPEGEAKNSMKESLEGIGENVQYVDKIVQDLQDYARPISPVAKEIRLEPLFEEVLFRNGIPRNVDASCRVEKKAKKIVTDPQMLKRVLTNLVTNSLQAMPKGGKLDIRAFRDTDDMVITVEDTGGGIPENVRLRLFTPLFTTKSKGQGFGLAVVKRMTELLGGTVSFESELGKGTKFVIRLPPPKKQTVDGLSS